MSATIENRLSKTRYCAGLRCQRAVYLSVHHYDLTAQPTPEQQMRFDAGNAVGELARDRYPGGILIAEDHFHHSEAVTSTLAALESGAPAIFEAAFTHHNVRVRADVLLRLPEGGFELIEVKSTTKYDAAKHLPDAGVQLYVLLGSGVDVRRVTLMHLDRSYEWPGGPYDPHRILKGTDITAEAFDYLACVSDNIEQMMVTLALSEIPEVTPGPACLKPYECSFYGWCTRDVPAPDFSGDVETVDSVLARLDELPFPLHFVDFETVNPALPLFPGTRPYQVVRTQWSIHTLHADGTLEHAEWLLPTHTAENPDRAFMESLLDALGTRGTFVHYSVYERTQLVDIAQRYPEFRQALVDRIPGFYSALADRLTRDGETLGDVHKPSEGGLRDFDLGVRIVKDGCLHPQLPRGAYTIKIATKLLASDLPPYEGLAVSNGDQAMTATYELLAPETVATRAEQIRRDLLEYCRQDTLAMVEIYRTLARCERGG